MPRLSSAATFVVAAAVVCLAGCGADDAQSDQGDGIATLQRSSTSSMQATADPEQEKATLLERYVADMRVFAQCLRDNGYVDAPDPDEYGRMRIGGPGVDPKIVNKAGGACNDVWPVLPPELAATIKIPDAPELTDAQIATEVEYAQCMQENGAPAYPDPGPDGLPVPSADIAYAQAGRPGEDVAVEICNPRFHKEMPFGDGSKGQGLG